MRIVVFVDVQTCLTREFCVFIHMYSVCMCVCVCVCVWCLDTGLYRRLPLKWMKLHSELQCEVRGEAGRGFKVRGDTFIHFRQTDGQQGL